MVFNRLCDPASKLGCLRWLETVAMPAAPEGVTHQNLLRAMNAALKRRAWIATEVPEDDDTEPAAAGPDQAEPAPSRPARRRARPKAIS